MSVPRASRFGCGHSTCCEACADILQARRGGCPVCRTPIRAIVERGQQLGNAATDGACAQIAVQQPELHAGAGMALVSTE
eukprot:3333169-Prymnesium_polylepis.1